MQIKVTDSTTGVTVLRDVERIDMRFPSLTTERRMEVYLMECICMGTKMFGQPHWIDRPLILDFNNPKIVQAIQLLKEVIQVEEHKRIVADHNIIPLIPKK